MMDRATVLMEDQGPTADGLGDEYWMAPQQPSEVRQRIEIVFEVLSHLPLHQPVAVVTQAGKTVAFNRPLLALLGGEPHDYLDSQWSRVMPGWPERVRGLPRIGMQVFEDHLAAHGADPLWVRVSFGPVRRRGEERALAYVLFITKPHVDPIDHVEVRRLRKSLQLFAEIQADYVVEIDGEGIMTFVSPSFCRAVGASERELVGHPFLARVHAEDRAAAFAALAEAHKPPFSGELQARLAADGRTPVVWHADAVVGAGFSGLDLVGRVQRGNAVAKAAAPV